MAREECSADLAVSANIPSNYVPSNQQRMDLYRRIAAIRGQEDASDLLDELMDRYGDPPKTVYALLDVAMLRASAARAGICDISQHERQIKFFSLPFPPAPRPPAAEGRCRSPRSSCTRTAPGPAGCPLPGSARAGICDISQHERQIKFVLSDFSAEAIAALVTGAKYRRRLVVNAGEIPSLTPPGGPWRCRRRRRWRGKRWGCPRPWPRPASPRPRSCRFRQRRSHAGGPRRRRQGQLLHHLRGGGDV